MGIFRDVTNDLFGTKKSKYYFVMDGFERKALVKALDEDTALMIYGEVVGMIYARFNLEEVSEVEAAKIHFYECGRQNVGYAITQSMWDEEISVLRWEKTC